MSESHCPDLEKGETAEDCPWAGIARELCAEAEAGRPLRPLFEARAPRMAHDIQQDGQCRALMDSWGRCVNYDENVGAQIVHPAVLRLISELAGTQLLDPVAHAGITHTYGYLFSLLATSFGYKRKRWVDGAIARGFNLPVGSLGPEPSQGTLLSNLTWFIGLIAFRHEPKALSALHEAGLDVAPELRGLSLPQKPIHRLEERVNVVGPDGRGREVLLRTDLVPFLSVTQGSDSHLLIYSVVDPSQGGARLITTFPTSQSRVANLLASSRMGERVPVSAQYNAYVEGITCLGARRV